MGPGFESQRDHDECLRKISWGIFVSAITGAITAYIGGDRHFEVEKYQNGGGCRDDSNSDAAN
jgi:hypothetical protein